jgi:hypothetical protein
MAGLASEVRTQQEARTIRRIPSGAILSLFMLAICEKGPIGTTELATDTVEWQTIYGGFIADGNGALAARGFFDNGGTRLWTSRVVHATDAANGDVTTKTSATATLNLLTASLGAAAGTVLGSNAETFDLEPGDDLDLAVDGGGTQTATFNATSASVTGTTTETFALADGQTLTWDLDASADSRSVIFLTSEFAAIGAATALEVAAVINAKATGISATVSAGAVVITSDRRGTDSELDNFGGTAVTTLGFNGQSDTGTGNVGDIDAVTAAESITIIDAATTGITVTQESGAIRLTSQTTGASSDVQVLSSSTADDEYGFDNAVHAGNDAGAVNTLQVDGKYDGDYANELSIQLAAATSGDSDEFKLQVIKAGVVQETFDNLSMTDTDANYVETVINTGIVGQGPSILISVTDLDAGLASPNDLPATGTFGPLTGGDDGLAGLVDADFSGGTGVNGSLGLRVFDEKDGDVLISPDRATSAVHNAMVTYTDITREGLLFSIIDPPANQTALQMVTYVTTTAALFNLTENAAIYWPRVKISNPSVDVYGSDDLLTVPPSGILAGIYARTDARKIGGAFEQPAGTEFGIPAGVLGFETDEVLKKSKRELIFPVNINPISRESEGGVSTPIFVDGARNLDITGNWPSVGQRRGVMFVEKRLKPGLAFLRHRNIKQKLYEEGKDTVNAFLIELTENEAFASNLPSEAFSVDFGPGLNTAVTRNARQVKARVGLATSQPAEFINILIGPDNDALDAQLAALAA